MDTHQNTAGSGQVSSSDAEKKADKELLMQGAVFGGILILVIVAAIVFS